MTTVVFAFSKEARASLCRPGEKDMDALDRLVREERKLALSVGFRTAMETRRNRRLALRGERPQIPHDLGLSEG